MSYSGECCDATHVVELDPDHAATNLGWRVIPHAVAPGERVLVDRVFPTLSCYNSSFRHLVACGLPAPAAQGIQYLLSAMAVHLSWWTAEKKGSGCWLHPYWMLS